MVEIRELDQKGKWRGDLPPSQVSEIDAALANVGERICGNPELAAAVRATCWFLQESLHQEILGNLRLHEDPVQARTNEMFLRGVARGIEFACDHMTQGADLRAVREWLSSTTRPGGENQNAD